MLIKPLLEPFSGFVFFKSAMRIILDYAITSNERATIFEVKLCNHGGTCKNC
jgi:hypothetical protein